MPFGYRARRRCRREPNPSLLLAPGIGQGLGEASDREVRRCGSIDDRRNDARRQKGKRDEQADVPFTQGLALGDLCSRALAIAVSRASRVSGFIAGFAQGA